MTRGGGDPEVVVRWEMLRARMRARRIALGLTQVEVAERMGRSQDYVSLLENSARSIPNLVTLWLWMDALGGEMEPRWKGADGDGEGAGRGEDLRRVTEMVTLRVPMTTPRVSSDLGNLNETS